MTLQTLERKFSKIRPLPRANRVYEFLIEKYPPREIKNLSEHRNYSLLLRALMRELSPEPDLITASGIRQYLGVLAPFIEKYEKERWRGRRTSGREILEFLMEKNKLSQSDLGEEIGSQPYVSDILSGKKELTSKQIQKLSERFRVSPAVFFP
jgi:HTH-type transcriptional regulator/antitoxin HigA